MDGMLQHGRPVYHVEKSRPFDSHLTLYGHVTGFLQVFFSKIP